MSTWRSINHTLSSKTEAEVLEMLLLERQTQKRVTILERLHQRYTTLRAARERIEIMKEATKWNHSSLCWSSARLITWRGTDMNILLLCLLMGAGVVATIVVITIYVEFFLDWLPNNWKKKHAWV